MSFDVSPRGIRASAAAWLLGALAWVWGVPGAYGARARHAPLHPVAAGAEVGRASYYGYRHAGKVTASGTRFAPGRLTAASPHLPLGSRAKVTNLRNGRSVDITVTDRGPVVRHRILDLSLKAADRLGMRKAGVTTVKVQPIAQSTAKSTAKAKAGR